MLREGERAVSQSRRGVSKRAISSSSSITSFPLPLFSSLHPRFSVEEKPLCQEKYMGEREEGEIFEKEEKEEEEKARGRKKKKRDWKTSLSATRALLRTSTFPI